MAESEAERKKRLRREKLEAWKRKKEAEKVSNVSSEVQSPVLSSTNINPPLRNVLKRPVSLGSNRIKMAKVVPKVLGFDHDQSLSSAPKARRQVQASDLEIDGSVDPLEAYFSSLPDDKKTASGSTLVEDEEAPGTTENSDQLNLLLDKLQPKKKAIAVDHSSIEYEPIIRDLYVETPEVAAADGSAIRTALGGVRVSPEKAPNPVWRWAQLGLNSRLQDILLEMGCVTPTAIQAQCVPAMMKGHDIMGVAETGSGKSLAFLLPILRHVGHQTKQRRRHEPGALILAPTRELAAQIANVGSQLDTGLRIMSVYGGENIAKQIARLGNGVDVLVGTPGRIIDLITLKKIGLSGITFVVIDEADRMFDMGFQPQIQVLLGSVRPDAQKALFSATFPTKLEKLARKVLKNNPIEVRVGMKGVNKDVLQEVRIIEGNDKFEKLLETIGAFPKGYEKFLGENYEQYDKILIFVDRQESAESLSKRLETRGYECNSLHGGKAQNEREKTIQNFSRGRISLLVATLVAARGLDVEKLGLVVNYDAPNHTEDYVHRAGRTGRAGAKGVVVTFIEVLQKREAYDVVRALKLSKVAVPEELSKLLDDFLKEVKAGKHRFFLGFGGKGLDRIDKEREKKKEERKRATGEEEKTPVPNSEASKEVHETVALLSDFAVHEGKAENSPDSAAFHAKVNINDLPQDVRWKATNRDAVKQLIEESGCSITYKGRFYKETERVGKEPKLYVLVEAELRHQVAKALELLKSQIIEAMRTYTESEGRGKSTRQGGSGKYVVGV